MEKIGEQAFSYSGKLASVKMRSGITEIGSSAFSYCKALTGISLPKTVTSLREYAFSNCTALTSAYLSPEMEDILKNTFYNCSAMTSVTIPSGVYTIGERAFYNCRALTGISFPSTIDEIGEDAFAYCVKLQSVTLPKYLTSLGEGAFSYGTALKSVSIPCEDLRTLPNDAFEYCPALSSVKLVEGLSTIDNSAFYGCDSLYSLTVPDSVTDIGKNVFPDNITLRGSDDSYVQYFAKSKGIPFKLKSDPTSDGPAVPPTQENTDLIYNGVQYAGSVMIDTTQYTMAPGNIYDVGVFLAGNAYTKTISVYSSRDGIASVARLANGNYRVTGVKPGTCYVVVDVTDGSRVLNHVSIRVDVADYVSQHGTAARNRSYFN